ncbi:hypothetical protein JHS3_24930 [Jeongeupia sp. HS-3]|nr:hypothetical protein JHS3_24930 [Jeongeupia sp. HS-3]
MADQRFASDLVQHLGQLRVHAFALTGGKDNDVERVSHGIPESTRKNSRIVAPTCDLAVSGLHRAIRQIGAQKKKNPGQKTGVFEALGTLSGRAF